MSTDRYAPDTLVIIIDRNALWITGPIDEVYSLEPLEDILRAFCYTVKTVEGNAALGSRNS